MTTISNITLRKWESGAAATGRGGGKGGGIGGGGSPEVIVVSNGSPSQRALAGPEPKFCPGDREQLLKRLATFQELTDWTPKPDRVNEIEWAKRGWMCQGKERVKCTLCARELIVKINRKEVNGKEVSVLIASEIEQAVVDKYAEMIVSSHAEDCLWKKKGCDGTSYLRRQLMLQAYTNCMVSKQTRSSACHYRIQN